MSTDTVLPDYVIELPYPKAKERLRELYVVETLARFGGNISRTARETTLSRRTIHRILRIRKTRNERSRRKTKK